jgi:hypothetical protein
VTQPSVEALIATTAGDRGFYFWVTSAALMDPNNITTATELNDVEAAVRALGGNIVVWKATSGREVEAAFAMLVQRRVGALYVGSGPFFNSQRERIHCAGGAPRASRDPTIKRFDVPSKQNTSRFMVLPAQKSEALEKQRSRDFPGTTCGWGPDRE